MRRIVSEAAFPRMTNGAAMGLALELCSVRLASDNLIIPLAFPSYRCLLSDIHFSSPNEFAMPFFLV